MKPWTLCFGIVCFTLTLTFSQETTPPRGGKGKGNAFVSPSLSRPSPPPPLLFLFRDDKALQVGDLVTVLVTQTTVASERSQTQTSKSVQIDLRRGTGLFAFIPTLGVRHSGAFVRQTQGRKSLTVVATIACRVVGVSPNGLLRIEGIQEFTIDKRKQWLKLSGWIRPQDVTPDNVVLSSQVAEARLEFRGDWRRRKAKTLLKRIVEGFNRLLRLLF